ncbi:MAG: UbiD family decarboxylase [Acidobacteria bacterium]|nr:UbiD family decarboxylase [Acidobacteriota bacterium]
MFPDLRTFMDRLRADADLVTITASVDAHLEAAEIHRRVIAAGGPALLFTSVKGRGFPLVTNLFGTSRRASLAFGEHPIRLIKRLVGLAETIMPPDAAKLWGARDVAGSLLKVGLKRQSMGPVTEVVTRAPRLDQLPALTCWPDDGGPFVTLPLVYTEHPGGHGHNLAMYRLHVHDATSTGMHWQIGKGGGFHYALAERMNQPLPATVFLGGPPALILSAIAPLPENVPELMLASLIAGERLARVPGSFGHPHPLVANCEFALMGEVRPFERRPEGPFGDHYGYYSLRHDYPVFRVHSVAHRHDAVYPATVVGKPRQEDFFIGDLLQELLSPLFPLVMPAVEQLWSYGETGYHALAAAVVKQRYPREAMASAFRILGEGQLSLQKFLLLTDRPVDVKDFRATLEHVLARTDPRTDLYVFGHLSMDTLDYAGPAVNKGSKGVWMGLGDAIRELPREFRPAVPPPADVTDVRVFCGGCLVVGARPFAADPDAAPRLAAHPAFEGWPLVVVSDEPERATRSTVNFLWTTFTRFEPAADIHAARVMLERNHVTFTPPVAIDARMKPWYPAEVSCDPVTAELVTRRWHDYFPDGKVTMGDAERGHLD